MISKNTVLVVGAGASAPYRFPTSAALRRLILGGDGKDYGLTSGGLIRVTQVLYSQDARDIGMTEYLKIVAGHVDHGRHFTALQSRFKDSEVSSIDSFLRFPDNSQLGETGRALIAGILMACEHLNREALGGNWYGRLWNYLIAAEATRKWHPQKLAVVTFNYDRSLQHYLVQKAGHTSDAMRKLVEGIRFEHVYGSLGPLTGGSNALPYGKVNAGQLPVAGIQLMHPRTEGNEKIRSMLEAAERIVFLGFGFDQMNLDTLDLGSLDVESKAIWGSRYNLDANFKQNADEVMRGNVRWGGSEETVDDFLHKHPCLY